MVGRLRPAAVVDLDGTLLNSNSLHAYIRVGALQLLRRGRICRLARVGYWLARRRLGIATHQQMKWGCASAIGFDAPTLQALHASLRPRLRQPLIDMLQQWQADTGGLVLVATAAFADYARGLLPQWPLVATPFAQPPSSPSAQTQASPSSFAVVKGSAFHKPQPLSSPAMRECRGEAKLAAAQQWLQAHGAYLHTAITDHLDDLPLLAAAQRPILVNPSPSTLAAASAAGLSPQVTLT